MLTLNILIGLIFAVIARHSHVKNSWMYAPALLSSMYFLIASIGAVAK